MADMQLEHDLVMATYSGIKEAESLEEAIADAFHGIAFLLIDILSELRDARDERGNA